MKLIIQSMSQIWFQGCGGVLGKEKRSLHCRSGQFVCGEIILQKWIRYRLSNRYSNKCGYLWHHHRNLKRYFRVFKFDADLIFGLPNCDKISKIGRRYIEHLPWICNQENASDDNKKCNVWRIFLNSVPDLNFCSSYSSIPINFFSFFFFFWIVPLTEKSFESNPEIF